jgi:hypothetical protein
MSCSGSCSATKTKRTLTQNLLLILFKTVGDIGCEFVYRGYRRFGDALVGIENEASKRIARTEPSPLLRIVAFGVLLAVAVLVMVLR